MNSPGLLAIATTAYLWLMALVWFSLMVVGFKTEKGQQGLIVVVRLVFAAWPLLCLSGCGGGDEQLDDCASHQEAPAPPRQPPLDCKATPEKCI